MSWISSIEELEKHYGTPPEAALVKVAKRLTPLYRAWIERSRFCFVATVGPEGTDCSPRGDDGAVVRELDPGTLAMPDWRGNNRMDTLRNIVRDGRISLSFMVPGSTIVVRVNGHARLTTAPGLLESFEQQAKHPRSVIVIEIDEIYTQCARALIRAGLWTRDDAEGLPSMGDILREMTQGAFDGKAYDEAWAERAPQTMW